MAVLKDKLLAKDREIAQLVRLANSLTLKCLESEDYSIGTSSFRIMQELYAQNNKIFHSPNF